MTILLYKDGKLIVDTEQPLEGVSLDNLAAILSGASDGDVIQYDATKGMWVNKSAPSSLPEVTDSDKGKYLKANESTGDPEWASGGSSGGVLVVGATFTETAMTLNKTWQEIHDADVAFVVVTDPWWNAGSKGTWLVCDVFDYDLEGRYVVFVMDIYQQDQYECVATSKSGYPVFQQS